MLMSHSHPFIFIHVAKAAGLSVRDALRDYAQEPEHFRIKRPAKIINGRPNLLYAMWKEALIHPTALTIRKEVGASVFNRYFKFAFVRNPWDLQVSMYHFIVKETGHQHHQKVKIMGSFSAYLDWMTATAKPFAKGAPKFQKDMLCDNNGQILADFVGRYENLQDDFAYICRRLNLKTQIAHLNQSSHRDYRYYYNQRTQNLVADYFQDDIALFGYEFEDYQNNADSMQRKDDAATNH